MVKLSGKQITGLSKITERHATAFKALVAAVDECGDSLVCLDLTDLTVSGLWRRSAFFALVTRPNLTIIVHPKVADILKSYTLVTGKKANYEVLIPTDVKKEDPRIQQRGEEYAKYATICDGVMSFRLADTGVDTVSSIGITGESVRRTLEIISKEAQEGDLKLRIDVTDILFEGGCDLVLASALVELRKEYRLSMRVYGDEGIAEYVRTKGNVKLTAEQKTRFFKRLVPGTVMTLNTYRDIAFSDIAGRKGGGVLAGTTFVIYRGINGNDALYDEIPIKSLYTSEDLAVLGEQPYTGDTLIPRLRDLSELGIYGLCAGSHAHFRKINKHKTYQVFAGNGVLKEITEAEFIARGLSANGIVFNDKLLTLGRIIETGAKMHAS